jgi:hypothetical protein
MGEPLLQIPRRLQIWDLDALRDSFVQQELIRATHKLTGNPLGSGAFLAAYIALQLEQHWLRHDECEEEEEESCEEFIEPLDPLRLAYLETLPNVNELSYHPILWKVDLLAELLGHSSVAFTVVHTYRNMVASEYGAFSQISPRFAGVVTMDRYAAARLNVLSRVFRTGRPGPEEEQSHAEGGRSLEEELRAYREILHMDLEGGEGCLAMIPIADLLNHHPSFNAIVNYEEADVSSNEEETSQGSFVVEVHAHRMDAGSEPVISYGDMSDAHLFGRYGFVVGDESGLTQIRLAYHHEVLNLSISDQYNYLPY